MMRRAARWLACLAFAAAAAAADDNLAARVILLANSDDPDSLRIARHYAEARGVPLANIVSLRMPLTETISWGEFITTIWQPLLAQLVRDQWIDAIPMDLTDAIGRKKYFVNGHRIAALVTCRGVPLKIADNKELFAEVLPFTRRHEFRTNAGAVDAELSLLALPNYPINAFIPNPLFQNERPAKHEAMQIVKVSRLDGPTVDDALGLVDRAMAAERTGLLGRAYVDIANRDALGDGWFEATARQLRELGFDTSVDRDNATMPAGARIDAAVLYFGWYAGSVNGPFDLPGFRFPPGAIVQHIHSFSALTMRQSEGGWTGAFVARGATATVGNVYEPYLTFSHRPNLLLKALARGATLVDAGYYALQAVSWQEVLIGDPLYRPFAVSLDEQLAQLKKLPPALAGYAVLRQMHRLDAAHREADATALAVTAQHDVPSLAVGLALAQRLKAANDLDGAANALGFAPLLKKFAPDEWAVAREAALLLEACGRPTRAVDVWRTVLAEPNLPRDLRAAWSRDAAKCARAAKDHPQAAAWDKAGDESERK
jgi:uncharacterized protein (TIGR03790 family)